jgi:hypothetical protein
MANGEEGVVIHVIVRDGSNGELLTVRRIDRGAYQPPAGHDARRIAEAIDGFDARYAYVGAVVYPPSGRIAERVKMLRSWRGA